MDTGYRVYYNKSENKYSYEVHRSIIMYDINDPELSSWAPSIGLAKMSADKHNRDHLPYIKFCKICGKPFLLKPDEENWFLRKNLTPPSRCRICRKKGY